jgi:hypothetical protein
MAIEEAIHVGEFASSDVTIANIIAAIEALLLAHKRIGVFFDLLAHFRMLLEILLQLAMVLDEFRVVYQRWILPKLAGNLGMTVEEAIEICQLTASGIAVWGCGRYGLSTCGRNRDQSRQSNERE